MQILPFRQVCQTLRSLKIVETTTNNYLIANPKSRPITVELKKVDNNATLGNVEIWYVEDNATNMASWGIGKANLYNLPNSYLYIQMANSNLIGTLTMHSFNSTGSLILDVLNGNKGISSATYPLSSAIHYNKVTVTWRPDPNRDEYAFYAIGDLVY